MSKLKKGGDNKQVKDNSLASPGECLFNQLSGTGACRGQYALVVGSFTDLRAKYL